MRARGRLVRMLTLHSIWEGGRAGMLPSRYDGPVIDRLVLGAIGRRPSLWGEAARAALALAPRGWWRRPPFMPIPDRTYLEWRIETAYGDRSTRVTPHDAVSYLEWRKRQRSQG